MELNSWQKIAIVVAALDDSTADRLLDQLDDEVAQRVRNSVLALAPIPPAVCRRVVNEFVEGPGLRLTSESSTRRGPARESAEGFPAKTVASAPPSDEAGTTQPWDPRTLACEQPQVIAAMVATAPPTQLRALLNSLPVAIEADVVRRMAKFGTPRTDVMQEVLERLNRREQQIDKSTPRLDEAALGRVQQLLHEEDAERREALLDALRQIDPMLAATLRSVAA